MVPACYIAAAWLYLLLLLLCYGSNTLRLIHTGEYFPLRTQYPAPSVEVVIALIMAAACAATTFPGLHGVAELLGSISHL